jgi:hypothetical protein
MPDQPDLLEQADQPRPRLSLVLCSRNDQWQGNSLWRLEVTLNFTARQAARIGRLDDVEIIVVDWGSTDLLSDNVRLVPEARQVVRFLNIPKALSDEKQRDSPFAEVYAINAAVQRSRGDHVGRIDQDTLVGHRFLEWFFATIESADPPFPIESTAMIANRRRIPFAFASRCLPFALVERYVDRFRTRLPLMRPAPPERYWECYIGIVLLPRKLWEAVRGYDETFIYYGHMEFDLWLRLLQQFEGIALEDVVDCDFHHLDHVRTWAVWRTVTRTLNPARSPENPPPETSPNGEDWGLTAYDLPTIPARADLVLPEAEATWRAGSAPRLAWETARSTALTWWWRSLDRGRLVLGPLKSRLRAVRSSPRLPGARLGRAGRGGSGLR